MAISFSDLHTESGIKSLNEFLAGKTYISGDFSLFDAEDKKRVPIWTQQTPAGSNQPSIRNNDIIAYSADGLQCLDGDQFTKDDIKVFAAVLEKPSGGFPNACRWYQEVSSHLAARFPGKACGVRFTGQAATTLAASTEEVKKEAPEEDDDDLDLFGEETEEEKKAAEAREAAVKASTKKKESGKSSVLLDVKPWDDETDMKKLEEAVRSVEMPGLLWGASKLAPVGYGIKKLQIMMTIVDDLVSVDNLVEDYLLVEPANEHIQSCDIVAFNKI